MVIEKVSPRKVIIDAASVESSVRALSAPPRRATGWWTGDPLGPGAGTGRSPPRRRSWARTRATLAVIPSTGPASARRNQGSVGRLDGNGGRWGCRGSSGMSPFGISYPLRCSTSCSALGRCASPSRSTSGFPFSTLSELCRPTRSGLQTSGGTILRSCSADCCGTGPHSRADLARATGLTKATVSTLVADLMERELVAELPEQAGARGRPATLLSPSGHSVVGLGMQIDVDHVSACAIDLTGRLLDRRASPPGKPDHRPRRRP